MFARRCHALHGHAVPLAGVAGDQQAALFGQACVDRGLGKNTYGTGSFVLLNTGFSPPEPPPGLLATVAWTIATSTTYALEASIFATGAAVHWPRDGLQVIYAAAETEARPPRLPTTASTSFRPNRSRLAPLGPARAWHDHRSHPWNHACSPRARDAGGDRLPDPRRRPRDGVRSGQTLAELRVDGGATANAWLMQFQADILGVPVVLAATAETTALGAAYLAGIGVGVRTISDIASSWPERLRYQPRMSADERSRLLAGWDDALGRARNFHGPAT